PPTRWVLFHDEGVATAFRPCTCLAEAWAKEKATQHPDLDTSLLNGVVHPKVQILGHPPPIPLSGLLFFIDVQTKSLE
ncbi:MAG TPA: hypothetical protein VN857_00085, partial [Chthoniobacterales bacterium]|nr:hypothetical protein [Chthoniobacterales bacterium]